MYCEQLCGCLRIIGRMLSALTFISIIIFPWIAEIILITYQAREHQLITMAVCGSIQTLVAVYSGIRLGIYWTKCGCNDYSKLSLEEKRKFGNLGYDTWCRCPTNYESMFSTGYPIYFLPQWVFTNMIIAWKIGSSAGMPLYVHLMVYMPLMVYLLSLFIGFSYVRATEYEETLSCAINSSPKQTYTEIPSQVKTMVTDSTKHTGSEKIDQ